jgi:predicted ATPase/DNA-binding CsgD family transcriptional regulator
MGTAGAEPAGSRPRPDSAPWRLPVPGGLFVGRSAELAAVSELLAEPSSRLLTLTGPPGIGKTRLALAAASSWAERTGHVVVFVGLADLQDAEAVLLELARALGVDHPDSGDAVNRVAEVVADTSVLLVVDNFEHILAAATDVGTLLAACPGLRVLATSRERLRLSSEREFPVPPLAMPAPSDLSDLSALATNPSVALLVGRAQRVRPHFGLTERNAESVVTACVRLEGVPLALELAAARLKVLSPAELVSRLSARMALLAGHARDVPARHRALRAAVAWSCALLDPAERALFRRLSVFVGGWTIEDVASVCELTVDEALVLIESLLDKSLVDRIGQDGPAQFRMLESLREYAVEELRHSGEAERMHGAHAAHYAWLAERFEALFGLTGEKDGWQAVGRHQANLRVALDHCLAYGGSGQALWLSAALGWFSYTRGEFGHGEESINRALAAAAGAGEQAPGDALIATLIVGGVLCWARDELDRARSRLTDGLSRADTAGDVRHATIAASFLGHVARAGGRYAEAARWHQRAELGFRRLNNPQGGAWVRYDLGLLARDRGDLAVAERWLRESLRGFRDLDYAWAVASAAWGLGNVLCARGEVDDAAPLLGEALEAYIELGDPRGVAQCLEALAQVAGGHAAHRASARLLGWAAAERKRLAAPAGEVDRTRIVAVEHALVRALGSTAFEQARQEGRAMPVGEACRLGRVVATGRTPAEPKPDARATLTRRERQVAALIASGRTNRQIGTALGIAEKTAEVHVQHVMAKLGARSRAEVAAWTVAHGLHDPTV